MLRIDASPMRAEITSAAVIRSWVALMVDLHTSGDWSEVDLIREPVRHSPPEISITLGI